MSGCYGHFGIEYGYVINGVVAAVAVTTATAGAWGTSAAIVIKYKYQQPAVI